CLSDWSSDVCSSDLDSLQGVPVQQPSRHLRVLDPRRVAEGIDLVPEVEGYGVCEGLGGFGEVEGEDAGEAAGFYRVEILPEVSEIGRASCREGGGCW